VALIIGLVLGLLIGWVWWPVSWTNASIADLSPGQQAAYVGAVAEAYTLDGTQDAARHMQARLSPFGANTEEAVTNAIEYYRGLPEPDEVMVANLALLAIDLGVPVDAAMMAAAPGAVAEEAVVDAAAVDAAAVDAAAPAERSRASGILTWILAVILSIGLIGAGFYLLMRLRAPRDLTDSMKDIDDVSSPGSLQPVAGSKPSARTTAWGKGNKEPTAGAAAPQTLADDDDLSFEDEDEEEPAVRFNDASGDTGAPDADDDFAPAVPRYVSARDEAEIYAGYTGSSFDALADDEEETDDAEDDDFGANDEPPAQDGLPKSHDGAQQGHTQGGEALPANAPPVDINALTPPSWATVVSSEKGAPKGGGKGASNAQPGALPIAATEVASTGVAVANERSRAAPVSAPATSAPATKAIASFTLQYHAGVPDYIEAHNITDPATGKYLGECGMGVSGKNPVLHDDPNQVIALDVWMYDKLDPRENANSTRVLLCPYAMARNLAQAFGDGSGDGTLEARKGTRFGVDGRNLYLDGELQDVQYDANGVFRTAKVRLNVRPKQA
jgi:hypothetical protein